MVCDNKYSKTCECPKKECPNHGICCECVNAHKIGGKNLPVCLRFFVK